MPERSVIGRVDAILRAHQGLVFHHDPPPTKPTTGAFATVEDLPLHPDLLAVLKQEYPRGLYRHQDLAIRHILDGDNTVVATQTSSGKSLIYSIPVFHSLLIDRNATALFIYPQKALANDQLEKLRAFAQSLPALKSRFAKHPYLVGRYDGATPGEIRDDVRRQVQMAITNPDMLHVALLQYHERHWARFFEHLKHVVVDECHEYRGIFGTNVAYILRRLRQICNVHGSSPSFVATSATIREPREHLEKLTGLPFLEVGPEQDGSLQGRKRSAEPSRLAGGRQASGCA
jgi:DEAD/DEAH box helicase domain-containing protein